ncbi:Protein MHF2-like protein, partial [Cucurbita argyrosperma subsp. argyrosperma]
SLSQSLVSLAMEESTFDPLSLFPLLSDNFFIFRFGARISSEREKNESSDAMDCEVDAGTSKKSRPMSANANALKLTSKLLQIFVSEAVQRAATIAEAEGISRIEATHLERILPQLLLDF